MTTPAAPSNASQRADMQPLKFYIFGTNIGHSLSPTIHNSTFAHLGLPHHYSIYEVVQLDQNVSHLLRQPDFGGASVTYPHKLRIGSFLDSMSQEAKTLGAINTVVVEEQGGRKRLRGDNTDWLGILNCLRHGGIEGGEIAYLRAIVIGAGGAARAAVYALQRWGLRRITIVNRTRKTAEQLVADFPMLDIVICDSLKQAPVANVVIGCIPADDVEENDVPASIFVEGSTGVVVEMSYRPPVSALMRVAGRRERWSVFGGVDVLKEQAYAQFELWTGLAAPVDVIVQALNEKQMTKR